MCGIVGVINGEASHVGITDVTKYIEQGTHVGQLRGDDSTGMFQVSRAGVVSVHKAPMDGYQFSQTKRFKSLANKTDTSIATIVHNRAATRGGVSYENCHPFEHSDKEKYLVGVHNGSLFGTPYTYDKIDFNVDSDYAFYRIFKDGTKAFKDLNGAYAFVWYENDGKIRVACNGERSFSFAFIHKKNAMLIASEAGMLWWLAQRNGIEIDDILSPESHRMLTFDPSSELRAFTDVKIDKFSKTMEMPAKVLWPEKKGVQQGNFLSPAQGTGAFSATKTGASALDTVSTELETYFKIGQDVDFYPDKEGCTPTQLVGTVLIEKPDNKTASVRAILSPATTQLSNNVRAGHIEYIVTSVRNFTKSTAGNGEILLCSGVTMTSAAQRELDLSDFIDGPGLIPLTKQEFREMTKNGCVCCKTPLTVQDGIDGSMGWNTSTSEPICSSCIRELAGVN